MDSLQLGTGIDSGVVLKDPAGVPVGAQGVGLPTVRVKRLHELTVQPLPCRVGEHHLLKTRDEMLGPSE